MLIVSLILSAFLLVIANGMVGIDRHRSGTVLILGGPLLVLFFLLACHFPPVALQALLLSAVAIVCRISRRGSSTFLPLSCGATLLAYGVAGLMVLQTEREYARLRSLYPFESLEGRLPTPGPAPRQAPLPDTTAQRLARMERGLREDGYRSFLLRMLHEQAVALFINSPGFGSVRMSRPTEWRLAPRLRGRPVPRQPGRRVTSPWSPGELERPTIQEEDALGRMFEDGVLDFANPRGWGYGKDRRHVAGFESHRFSETPAPAEHWEVQTLDLVGLLLHDEPVVYVSDQLPRMERRRDVPTRPPDDFEAFGLKTLQGGEDLLITRAGDGLRMLGAVRSLAQCVACHGGERGDLLGAFSYTLRHEGR